MNLTKNTTKTNFLLTFRSLSETFIRPCQEPEVLSTSFIWRRSLIKIETSAKS